MRKGSAVFVMLLWVAMIIGLLAACGQSRTADEPMPSNEESSTTQELTHIKISFNKNGGQTPLFVAEKYGFYEKHGLKVERVEFENQINQVSAMTAGQLDIMAAIPSFVWGALEQGYDLVAFMQNETAKKSPPDSGALIARHDSGVQKLNDLAGKKVSCNSLASIACVEALYLLKQENVDVSEIQIVEAPFTAHYDLLKSGQVDAVVAIDPFTTRIMVDDLGEILSYYYVDTVPGQPLGAWWAHRDWLEKNSDIAKRFQAAIKDSIDFLKEDDERARKEVGDFIGLDEEILKNMPILNWDYQVDPATWERANEIMVEMGMLNQKLKTDDYFSDLIQPFIVTK